jgi:hypothetical protein
MKFASLVGNRGAFATLVTLAIVGAFAQQAVPPQ